MQLEISERAVYLPVHNISPHGIQQTLSSGLEQIPDPGSRIRSSTNPAVDDMPILCCDQHTTYLPRNLLLLPQPENAFHATITLIISSIMVRYNAF